MIENSLCCCIYYFLLQHVFTIKEFSNKVSCKMSCFRAAQCDAFIPTIVQMHVIQKVTQQVYSISQ